jgi:hypothetical protein
MCAKFLQKAALQAGDKKLHHHKIMSEVELHLLHCLLLQV